jgi:hypothetical protein
LVVDGAGAGLAVAGRGAAAERVAIAAGAEWPERPLNGVPVVAGGRPVVAGWASCRGGVGVRSWQGGQSAVAGPVAAAR